LRRTVVTLLAVGLLAGAGVAFALTERLKLERSPVTAPRFERFFAPGCRCGNETARLSIRLRKAERIDAAIIDRDDDVVRTLATDLRRSPGRVALEWDGRTETGEVAPDGRYRLRLRFDETRRTIVIPVPIEVDTVVPEIELLDSGRGVLSPDGDRRNDSIRVTFRASEKLEPILLIDREEAVRGDRIAPGPSELFWDGTVNGRVLPAGLHILELRAVDRAGNLSESSLSAGVRIRFIDLTAGPYRVQRGRVLRFEVDTDVPTYLWSLARRRGSRVLLSGEGKAGAAERVRLPRPIRAGRYLLRVVARGHSDRATVFVTRRR
jgi:flagellar hook capping protein FlgD